MKRHQERITVQLVGDLNMDGARHETSEDAAISLCRSSSELHIHRSEVIDSDVRERWARCGDALSRKVCHLLFERLAVVTLALDTVLDDSLDLRVTLEWIVLSEKDTEGVIGTRMSVSFMCRTDEERRQVMRR